MGSRHQAGTLAHVKSAELVWSQWSEAHFIPFAQRINICHVRNRTLETIAAWGDDLRLLEKDVRVIRLLQSQTAGLRLYTRPA